MKRKTSVMKHLMIPLLLFALCNCALAQNVSISFNARFSFNDTPAAIQSVNLLPSCTATGFAAQTILRFEWRFNGTSSYVNSVSVIGGRATATFTIAAPTKANAGWYTCVASSGNISVQTSAYLAVAYVEVDPLLPSTIEGPGGQNITLTCPVTAYPAANIYTWYRDTTASIPISNQPTYDVVNASLSDAGTYLCKASNGYASVTAVLKVFVLVPPVIHKANTTYVTIGNTLRLNCIADSVQTPSYSWWSGNQLVANTSRITVSSGSSLLSVGQVAYSDSGVYTCVASNSIGQDTADFQVIVQGPPNVTVPNGGMVIAPEGSSPSLVCMWLACPTPVVNWTMVGDGGVSRGVSGSRYSSPSVGTLVIGQVGGPDEGTYLCSFRNALGNMTAPIGLVVLEIPTGLVVSSVGGHTLEIQWNAITSRTRVDQYILEYGTQGSTVSKNVTFPGNSTAGMLTGLNGGTTYLLRLRAIKLGMKGPPGDQVMATTTTTVPVVALVSVNPLEDGRSLQVFWHISDAGGVSIQAINITVRLNGTVVQTLAVQAPWPQSYLITGLMPSTTYTIEVSVGNAVGMSSVASPITTPLAPPATPTKPSIVAETSHTISLKTSIDFVGSAPVQFILINISELQSGLSQVLNVSINDNSVVQSLNATMTSLGISLLIGDMGGLVKPYVVYVFSVAASNDIGASHFSDPTDPASLVSPSDNIVYYIIAGIVGGVIAAVVLLVATMLLYTYTANCRRGKRISINPHNGDSPLVSRGYSVSEKAMPTPYSPCPVSTVDVPPVNQGDHAHQDPHRGIPSPLDLSKEVFGGRCGSRGGTSSHHDPREEVLSQCARGPHDVLHRGASNPLELHRGANSPSDLRKGAFSPIDLRVGARSPNNFHHVMSKPADLSRGPNSPSVLVRGHSSPHNLHMGVTSPQDPPCRSLHSPHGQLASPLCTPLDPQGGVYKFPPSDVQGSPFECSSIYKHITDHMTDHMTDDGDNLSSAPTSIVQGPRPSFRQLPLTDKGSLSSDRSDVRVNTFPGLDIDVPCNISYSIKDSLFELDSIDIPKASYMTDV